MKFRKQTITSIRKVDNGYTVSRAQFVGLNLDKSVATFDFSTNTANFFGHKIRTKDVDMYFKDVKAHYSKKLKLR